MSGIFYLMLLGPILGINFRFIIQILILINYVIISFIGISNLFIEISHLSVEVNNLDWNNIFYINFNSDLQLDWPYIISMDFNSNSLELDWGNVVYMDRNPTNNLNPANLGHGGGNLGGGNFNNPDNVPITCPNTPACIHSRNAEDMALIEYTTAKESADILYGLATDKNVKLTMKTIGGQEITAHPVEGKQVVVRPITFPYDPNDPVNKNAISLSYVTYVENLAEQAENKFNESLKKGDDLMRSKMEHPENCPRSIKDYVESAGGEADVRYDEARKVMDNNEEELLGLD